MDGRVVRRVVSVKEVVPRNDSVEVVEVFRYIPKEDLFEPNDIHTLVQRSAKLNQASHVLNIKLSVDLRKRISLLDRCVEENATTVQQVFSILERYYSEIPM